MDHPLDKQCAAEDDSRSVWSDMEVLLVRGRIREALDHRAHGSYVGVHVDVFSAFRRVALGGTLR